MGNSGVFYPAYQVLLGAAVAYCSCVSGNNDSYVSNKSELFLNRCRKFDCIPDDEMTKFTPISREAVAEIAYAALDSSCESVLWNYLSGKELREENVEVVYELPEIEQRALEAPGSAYDFLM